MELGANIALLLMQIVLRRQQELSHSDKSLDKEQLLKDPVIDESILAEFTNHRLVKLYAPDLQGMQLRMLRSIIRGLFEAGLPDKDAPVTVVTLANHFYYSRVAELEAEQIPALKQQILDLMGEED